MNSKFSRLRPLGTVLLVLMAMSLAFEARQSRAESPGVSEALKKFADLDLDFYSCHEISKCRAT